MPNSSMDVYSHIFSRDESLRLVGHAVTVVRNKNQEVSLIHWKKCLRAQGVAFHETEGMWEVVDLGLKKADTQTP